MLLIDKIIFYDKIINFKNILVNDDNFKHIYNDENISDFVFYLKEYLNINLRNNVSFLYFEINNMFETIDIHNKEEIDNMLNDIIKYLKNLKYEGFFIQFENDKFFIVTDNNIDNILVQISKILSTKHLTATYGLISKRINENVELTIDKKLLENMIEYSKYTYGYKNNILLTIEKKEISLNIF